MLEQRGGALLKGGGQLATMVKHVNIWQQETREVYAHPTEQVNPYRLLTEWDETRAPELRGTRYKKRTVLDASQLHT